MKYSISTEDNIEALQLALNTEAWTLLSRIDNRIRHHFKYEDGVDTNDVLQEIRFDILDMLNKVDV